MTRANGVQDVVLEAVKSGHHEIEDIMQATGYDKTAVKNALRRLQDRTLIVRDQNHYRPVDSCLFAEIWK